MSHTNHLNIIDLYLLIEREKSSICINKEMKKLIKKDKNLKKAEKLELVEQINDKICTSQFIMTEYGKIQNQRVSDQSDTNDFPTQPAQHRLQE